MHAGKWIFRKGHLIEPAAQGRALCTSRKHSKVAIGVNEHWVRAPDRRSGWPQPSFCVDLAMAIVWSRVRVGRSDLQSL